MLLLHHGHHRKWCFREDLHLDPPPSLGGVHYSYTSEALKNLHSMPVLPRLLRRERPLC